MAMPVRMAVTVSMRVSMAVTVGVPMLWLLSPQSWEPFAAVNDLQLGVPSAGDQPFQKRFHTQPVDHQHIRLSQQTNLLRPSLKAVGPHLGRD